MRVEIDSSCPSYPEKMASAVRHIALPEIPSLKQVSQNPRNPCTRLDTCWYLYLIDKYGGKGIKKEVVSLLKDSYGQSHVHFYLFIFIFLYLLFLRQME